MKRLIKILLKFISTFIAKRMLGGFGESLRVNDICRFTKNTYVGKCCNFNGLKIHGKGKVIIGDYFHSGKDILFITENHNYEGEKIPYDSTTIKKDIIIEDCVWIGTRVTICGGVTLGEGCIIQAGSVVVKDIPPYGIAGGHPATVFKYRDIEHYKLLKEQNKYF